MFDRFHSFIQSLVNVIIQFYSKESTSALLGNLTISGRVVEIK